MYYIRFYSYIALSVLTLHIVSYFLVILYDYFASVEILDCLYVLLIFFRYFLNEIVFVLKLTELL